MTSPKTPNIDDALDCVHAFDWSKHIHWRYERKLFSSSCACDTHRAKSLLLLPVASPPAGLGGAVVFGGCGHVEFGHCMGDERHEISYSYSAADFFRSGLFAFARG